MNKKCKGKLVKTVSEYLERIGEITKEESAEYAYRGQNDIGNPVSSSAVRRIDKSKIELEREERFIDYNKTLVENAKMKGYHHIGATELKDLELLAELQHHGAATCLIDFTRAALVALYFACEGKPDQNGAVYIINIRDTERFKEISTDSIILKIGNLLRKLEKELWIWEPSDLNNRIPKQHSLFVFGKPDIENKFWTCIEIDKNKKIEILSDLKMIHNIDDITLFSDLPGFAKANSHDKPYFARTFIELLVKGTNEYQKGDFKNALYYLNEAIKLDPKNARAYNIRGLAKYESENYEDAILDYDKAIVIDSKYVAAYNNRGNAKSELGDHKGAILDFDKAIKYDPKNAIAYTNRGNSKSELGNYKGAIADYNRAIKSDPKDTTVYFNYGIAKSELGDFKGAITNYDQAIKNDPKNAGAYNNRGNAKHELGDLKGAIADYDEAIELNPKYIGAYSNRGNLKSELGDLEGAISDYNEIIKIDPDNKKALDKKEKALKKLESKN